MKYQNRHERKWSSKKSNIGVLSHATRKRKRFIRNCTWQVVYNRKDKHYRIVSVKISPSEYVVYSVLNTGVNMRLGVALIMIVYSILGLCNKLAADPAKNACIKEWEKAGRKILILRGCNHKHLKYIEREAKFVSIATHAVNHAGVMLVLSVFGRKEEIEDIFEGLRHIR